MGFFGGTLGGIGSQAGMYSEAAREKRAEDAKNRELAIQESYAALSKARAANLLKYGNPNHKPTPAEEAARAEELGRYTYGAKWDTMPEAQKVAYRERMLKVLSPAYIRPGLEESDDSDTGVATRNRDPITGDIITSHDDPIVPGLLQKKAVRYKQVPQADGSIDLVPVEESTGPQIPGKPPVKLPGGPQPTLIDRTPMGNKSKFKPPSAALTPGTANEGIGKGVKVGHVPPGKVTPGQVPLTTRDFAADADKLGKGEITYAEATKNMSKGDVARFNAYLRDNKITVPNKKTGNFAAGNVAGLNILTASLFGSTDKQGAYNAGLIDSLGVFDSPVSRAKLSAIMGLQQQRSGGSYWQHLTPDTVLNLVSAAGQSTLTEQEAEYLQQLRRAASTIVALRQYTGNPRYTEALATRFIQELPDPMTTANSRQGRAKLSKLLVEIQKALETLSINPTGPAPGPQLPPTVLQPPIGGGGQKPPLGIPKG